jgi:hypothetical protein|nr:MAG TPA: YjcQ protein [Caudoviricetes sp.]
MIEITPIGIAFLQENSMMKKALNILKHMKDLGFSLAGLIK